jgi:hypothetical protein
MKKNYSGLSILICLSFLFTLDSCTTDTLLVLDDALGKTGAKNEIYYNSRKGNAVAAHSEDSYDSAGRIHNELFETHYEPDSFQESISTYSVKTLDNQSIDPDWKKLVTHFIESNGSAE